MYLEGNICINIYFLKSFENLDNCIFKIVCLIERERERGRDLVLKE